MRYRVEEPDEENVIHTLAEYRDRRRVRFHPYPSWMRSAARAAVGSAVDYGARALFNYGSNKLKQTDLKSFFRTGKRDRSGEVREVQRVLALPGPEPQVVVDQEQKMSLSTAAGGVWQGRFPGEFVAPKQSKLYKGYRESVLYTGQTSKHSVNYLGVTSFPPFEANGDQTGCRVLTDIIVAILRKFFKDYHPGKIEFERADDPIYPYINAFGVYGDTKVVSTNIRMMYRTPDGSSISTGVPISISSSASPKSMRDVAISFGSEFLMKWKAGYEPHILQTYGTLNTVDLYEVNHASMRIDQVCVSVDCLTTVKVQNQTLAEVGDGIADADLTTNISSNPLRGKILLFKGLAPVVGVGYNPDATVVNDEWFQNTMRVPNTGTLTNIIIPSTDPSGGWAVVPPAAYFKNCIGEKSITLEPGAQRYFDLKFSFTGYLVTFLRKFRTVYNIDNATALNVDLSYGMGNCAVLCLEKRIRNGNVPVVLDYQVNTHITTEVMKKQLGMIHHVESNAT